jgi:hypothetical protein
MPNHAITHTGRTRTDLLWWRHSDALPAGLRVRRPTDDTPLSIEREYRRFGRFIGVLLEAPIEPGATLVIEWEGAGSVEDWGFIQAHEVPGPPEEPPPPGFLESSPLHLVTSDASRLTHADALMERYSILRGTLDPVAADAARFWWYVDVNTVCTLAKARLDKGAVPWGWDAPEGQLRDSARSQLEGILVERITSRRAGRCLPCDQPSAGGPGAAALHCHLLRRIAEHVFGPFREGTCADRIAIACHRFGTGSLRLSRSASAKPPLHSNGAPDSWMICCFPELALYAIEQGIDNEFWATLLPAFIELIESFRRAYVGPIPLPVASLRELHAIDPSHRGGPPISDHEFAAEVASLRGATRSDLEQRLHIRLASVIGEGHA